MRVPPYPVGAPVQHDHPTVGFPSYTRFGNSLNKCRASRASLHQSYPQIDGTPRMERPHYIHLSQAYTFILSLTRISRRACPFCRKASGCTGSRANDWSRSCTTFLSSPPCLNLAHPLFARTRGIVVKTKSVHRLSEPRSWFSVIIHGRERCLRLERAMQFSSSPHVPPNAA